MRSMIDQATGWRPLPALGYGGAIEASNSGQGTTVSMVLRNCSRRLGRE